jgi:hypothetical protein
MFKLAAERAVHTYRCYPKVLSPRGSALLNLIVDQGRRPGCGGDCYTGAVRPQAGREAWQHKRSTA